MFPNIEEEATIGILRIFTLIIPYCHINSPKIAKIIIRILFLFLSTLQFIEAMRVHPLTRKRNLSFLAGLDLNEPQMGGNPLKKLRRLPHVFSKVLELPFKSDADVTVEEGPDFFRFVAELEVNENDDIMGDVRAQAVEIHSGIVKIVIRNDDNPSGSVDLSLDKLEVDMWRFRLPADTRPEETTAMFVSGELIVTVPKGVGLMDGREVWGGGTRLVLVQ